MTIAMHWLTAQCLTGGWWWASTVGDPWWNGGRGKWLMLAAFGNGGTFSCLYPHQSNSFFTFALFLKNLFPTLSGPLKVTKTGRHHNHKWHMCAPLPLFWMFSKLGLTHTQTSKHVCWSKQFYTAVWKCYTNSGNEGGLSAHHITKLHGKPIAKTFQSMKQISMRYISFSSMGSCQSLRCGSD